jgi:hypothetical protein
LIARDDYWVGRETFKKEYDTYENLDLVNLNKNLLRDAGYAGRYEMQFRKDLLERIESMGPSVSDTAYRDFLAECNQHQPWVWKDPRLWVTIRYWHHLLDWNRCKVIVLTRILRHAVNSQMALNTPVGVERINGQTIRSLADVTHAFSGNQGRFHTIELEGDGGIEALDRARAEAAHPEILKQYAIPSDHRP